MEGEGRREIGKQLHFRSTGLELSAMRPTSDLSGGVRNLGVNPGVIAAQSQISTSKWDNGDAWDARDTNFLSCRIN